MQQGFGEQNLSAESFRMAWAWGSAAEQQALGCPLLDSGSGRLFHAPRVLAICVPVLHALPIHTWDLGTGREDPLEDGTATHSSILAGQSMDRESLVGYSP